jgi:hypothetical protein
MQYPASMFEGIKYHLELKKLHKEQDKILACYLRDKKQALAEKRIDDIEILSSEASGEDMIVRENIDSLVTRYWLRQAARNFIPVPDRKDETMWKDADFDRRRFLTEKGISAVRTAVREEKRQSRELWATIGSALIGAIGAATGLAAVLVK